MWRHIILLLLCWFAYFGLQAQDPTGYISPFKEVDRNKAPGVTYKLLSDKNGIQEYAIVFAKGDEVISGLTDFAIQHHITSARFTGIGAAQHTLLGWFDLSKKLYKPIAVNQQAEIISLLGDIAMDKEKPVVHAHCGVATSNGDMQGGHLLEAIVYPTIEVFMTVFPVSLHKEVDTETDVKLIHPEIK